ncbi:MAG: sulfatase-like hydrolase/transferase [Armatimonadetes bacterium]|nr:sulfatase-like hydrolase/transferase [Armatimonadota bacterium]
MTIDRPNILLITSDQQHWNTLGCLNPEVQTPFLDRMAAEGTLFNRAYTVNPTCTPTRASMITGRFPSQHGAYSLGTKLSEEEPTVGPIFGSAGYRTALVGKAHFQPLRGTDEYPSLEAYPVLQDLDFWRRFTGPFYGFERVELARNHTDEAHVGQHYAIWMEERGLTNWRDYFRPPTGNNDRQRRKWLIPEEYHYSAWIAERTNALMEQYASAGENFLLWASFFDPHPAYLAPEPWDTMYDPSALTVPSLVPGEHDCNPPHFQLTQQEKPDFSPWQTTHKGLHGFHSHLHDRDELAKNIAVYYGMISLMDKYIGAILDRLDSLGLAENTLVLFSTDHGHLFGHHGLIAKGAFHYEDLLRVPMIARMPGTVPAGRRTDALWSHVDLAPTCLGMAGLEIPWWMTGVDQTGVLRGEQEQARDHVLVENRHEVDTIHVKTYVDDRYKITAYYRQRYGELFDLAKDPHEVHNLWDSPEHQDLKRDLLLKLLWAEMGNEPVWMPRVAGA